MLCPMRKVTTTYCDAAGYVLTEIFQECMGTECTWWDSNNQTCVVYRLRALGELVKQG